MACRTNWGWEFGCGVRDWGYAKDYVVAMWKMLQVDVAGDYVVGTGESHRVTDFLQLAFDARWIEWRDYVVVDSRCIRPTEVEHLVADATQARNLLDWKPTTSFEGLVEIMMDHDLQLAREAIKAGATAH